jgi:hypothetical protein
MLDATQRLRALLSRPAADHGVRFLERAYAEVITNHGSAEDAAALLLAFLQSPEGREELLGPLMAHGDLATARALFESCFHDGELKPGVPPEVLHCLGWLGLQEVEPVLWKYARAAEDWFVHCDACLGLLSLPCDGLASEIETAIRSCFGLNLFPEFLPALAYKTGNLELLPLLVEHGKTTASVDCNGGLILGIAMYGPAGREAFLDIMWDPFWEADGSATGARWWLCLGARAQGLRIVDLFEQFRRRRSEVPDQNTLRYHASCLAELLNGRLEYGPAWVRPITDQGDDLLDLHRLVFEPTAPDARDCFLHLWHDFLHDNPWRNGEASYLKRRLERQIVSELRLSELAR